MRKKLQEDEEVDILGGVDDLVDHKVNGVAGDPDDEDLEWADDELDDDQQGWRLKVIMVDDDDAY
jgi:COMPASS component SWD1